MVDSPRFLLILALALGPVLPAFAQDTEPKPEEPKLYVPERVPADAVKNATREIDVTVEMLTELIRKIENDPESVDIDYYQDAMTKVHLDKIRAQYTIRVKDRTRDPLYNKRAAEIKPLIAKAVFTAVEDEKLLPINVTAKRMTQAFQKTLPNGKMVTETIEEEFPTISWEAHPQGNLYTIYRKFKDSKQEPEFIGLSTGIEFVDKSGMPAVEYCYYVRVITPQGEEGPPNPQGACAQRRLVTENLQQNLWDTRLNWLEPAQISTFGNIRTPYDTEVQQ